MTDDLNEWDELDEWDKLIATATSGLSPRDNLDRLKRQLAAAIALAELNGEDISQLVARQGHIDQLLAAL
jgi:hypothetical protein